MKRILLILCMIFLAVGVACGTTTTTTNLELVKPDAEDETVDWYDTMNANMDLIDAAFDDPLEFSSDTITKSNFADEDWGDVSVSGNSVTLDANVVDATALNVTDVSDNIAADIAEGELADSIIVSADIKDGVIAEADLKVVNTPNDEEIFTYEATTGDFEWHTLLELSIQPLEATLTDIADGTIEENLVNTTNPWADNEITNDPTITAADTNDATSFIALWETVTGAQKLKSDPSLIYDASTGMAGANNIFFGSFANAVAPAVTDDVDGGFVIGSIWIDTTADEMYVCLDNSDGAAVWSKAAPGGGGGSVDTSGTPVDNDFAVFTDADTIEGKSYAESKALLDIGTNIVLCSNYDHPDDAITAISTSERTLLVTENETCDASFTVPANVTVVFEADGLWAIANGVTVTFNGQIHAKPRQIFSYTGTGVLAGTPKIDKAYPQWWGALGDDSNDDTAAIQSAINFTDNICFPNTPSNKYHCTAEITLNSNTYLYFTPGAELEVVMGVAGDFITATSKSNIKIENLRITDETSVDEYILFNTCDGVLIDNAHLTGTPDWAIEVLSSSNVVIQNSYFSACVGGVSVAQSEHVIVQRCETYDTYRSGLRVTWGCSNVYFMYNKVNKAMQGFDVADGAISCYGGTDPNNGIYIIGNEIDEVGIVDDGHDACIITVADTNDFYILNNVMTDSAEMLYGIYLWGRENDGTENGFIEGNIFNIGSDNYSDGFIRQTNDGFENLTIKNNYFLGTTDNTTKLIYLRINMENTIIEGNIVDLSSLYAFVYSYTGLTINGLTINNNQVRLATSGRTLFIDSGADVMVSNNIFNAGTNSTYVIEVADAVTNISVIDNIINCTGSTIEDAVEINRDNLVNGAIASGTELTDDEVSDTLTSSLCTGQAATVATITGLAPDTATTATAQTGIESILNAALVVGRDTDNTINFATDNTIKFQTNGVANVEILPTGELDFNAFSAVFTEQVLTPGTAVAWDLGNSNKATLTPAQNFTVTITAPSGALNAQLIVTQDGTGSRVMDEIITQADATIATTDVHTDTEIIDITIDIPTGARIRFDNDVGTDVPEPLVEDTIYYAIRQDATHIKVATTKALAIAGTNVDITDQGTNVHTVEQLVKWPSGTLGVLTTDAGAEDILALTYKTADKQWYGMLSNDFY